MHRNAARFSECWNMIPFVQACDAAVMLGQWNLSGSFDPRPLIDDFRRIISGPKIEGEQDLGDIVAKLVDYAIAAFTLGDLTNEKVLNKLDHILGTGEDRALARDISTRMLNIIPMLLEGRERIVFVDAMRTEGVSEAFRAAGMFVGTAEGEVI